MSARQPRAFHSLRGLRSLTAPWGMPAAWAGEPSMDGCTQPRLCGHGVSPACWPACCGSNSCLALHATGGRGCQKPCQSSAWNLLGVTTRAPPPSPDVPEPQLELSQKQAHPRGAGPPVPGPTCRLGSCPPLPTAATVGPGAAGPPECPQPRLPQSEVGLPSQTTFLTAGRFGGHRRRPPTPVLTRSF